MGHFLAFDLEIATEIPEGTDDWKALRPLGISCAATMTDDGLLRLWHGPEHPDGRLAERMSPEECRALADYLAARAHIGYQIVTWNGLGFDFDVLQEECGAEDTQTLCRHVALYDHIDIAFQMLCEKGFMIGLDAAAKGMGLAGKTEGMHGDLAPVLWRQGRAEQARVLEYVAQDVRSTVEVYAAICRAQELRWVSRSGRPQLWLPRMMDRDRLLTVEECLQIPEPDTSWMSAPWPRAKFCGWLTG